ILSGSGYRQKYCPDCRKRGTAKVRGFSASKALKTKDAWTDFVEGIPPSQLSHLTTPDGDPARTGREGEEVYWRVSIAELKDRREKRCDFSEPREATADIIRIEGNSHVPLTRLKPNPPSRDPACVQADIWPRPWGYNVRVYIEAEKELQELGCGWRTVIVELEGRHVHLHHNGRAATMKRDAFKAFLARNRNARRKRPSLRLVVSNPPKVSAKFQEQAA